MPDDKLCSKCGALKPLSAFYPAKGMRDGRRNDCIECNKAAKRERYARDPAKHIAGVQRWREENAEHAAAYSAAYRKRPDRKRAMRDLYYRRTYGLSADDVDAIFDRQGRRCAICGEARDRLASMHLDHDHSTGEIRGFLCLDCNQGLGKFAERPDRLLRAVVYLRNRGVVGLMDDP